MMDKQKANKSKRGTTIVEAAIVLPILLLLTFGGLKYGWLFIKWQQITNVTRHAVRYAVTYPTPTDPAPSTLISNLMGDAGIPYEIVEFTTGAGVGDPVTLRINVTVADIDILQMPFLPAPEKMGAKMTMSQEGPGSSNN